MRPDKTGGHRSALSSVPAGEDLALSSSSDAYQLCDFGPLLNLLILFPHL